MQVIKRAVFIEKPAAHRHHEGIKQPFLSIIAQNTDPEKKEDFLKVIRDTLQKIAEEGVPERSLRAAINSAEFRYREADYGSYPKGLMLGRSRSRSSFVSGVS